MTPSPESTLSRSPLRNPASADTDTSGGILPPSQGQRTPASLPEEQIHAAKTYRDRRISHIYSAASDALSLTVAEQQQNHSKFSNEEQEPIGTSEEASGEEINMNLIQLPEPSTERAAERTESKFKAPEFCPNYTVINCIQTSVRLAHRCLSVHQLTTRYSAPTGDLSRFLFSLHIINDEHIS